MIGVYRFDGIRKFKFDLVNMLLTKKQYNVWTLKKIVYKKLRRRYERKGLTYRELKLYRLWRIGWYRRKRRTFFGKLFKLQQKVRVFYGFYTVKKFKQF